MFKQRLKTSSVRRVVLPAVFAWLRDEARPALICSSVQLTFPQATTSTAPQAARSHAATAGDANLAVELGDGELPPVPHFFREAKSSDTVKHPQKMLSAGRFIVLALALMLSTFVIGQIVSHIVPAVLQDLADFITDDSPLETEQKTSWAKDAASTSVHAFVSLHGCGCRVLASVFDVVCSRDTRVACAHRNAGGAGERRLCSCTSCTVEVTVLVVLVERGVAESFVDRFDPCSRWCTP